MTTAHTLTNEIIDLHPRRADMRAEVLAGLARRPKRLPSKYLYDERGAALFDQICRTPEYDLTRVELRILRANRAAIAAAIGPHARIIEPGSGAGLKTRLLLRMLDRPAAYVPIDLARPQLAHAAARLSARFPRLTIRPICADFTAGLTLPAWPAGAAPDAERDARNLVFFPGSTIGNLEPHEARAMLTRMAALAAPHGAVLIGVDRRKDRRTIEAAYNDRAGLSAAFALNVLHRLNRELGADFDADAFAYEAPYCDPPGRVEMALVSRRRQTVYIPIPPPPRSAVPYRHSRGANDEPVASTPGGKRHAIPLRRGERLITEYSYKYDPPEFAALAASAGLGLRDHWTDPRRRFSLFLLTPR